MKERTDWVWILSSIVCITCFILTCNRSGCSKSSHDSVSTLHTDDAVRTSDRSASAADQLTSETKRPYADSVQALYDSLIRNRAMSVDANERFRAIPRARYSPSPYYREEESEQLQELLEVYIDKTGKLENEVRQLKANQLRTVAIPAKSPLEKEWTNLHKACMKTDFEDDFTFIGLGNRFSVGTILDESNIPIFQLNRFLTKEEFSQFIDTTSVNSCNYWYTVEKTAGFFTNLNFKVVDSLNLEVEKERFDSAEIKLGGYQLIRLDFTFINSLPDELKKKMKPYFEALASNPRNKIITKAIKIKGFDANIYFTREREMEFSASSPKEASRPRGDISINSNKTEKRKTTASCQDEFTAFLQFRKVKKVKNRLIPVAD